MIRELGFEQDELWSPLQMMIETTCYLSIIILTCPGCPHAPFFWLCEQSWSYFKSTRGTSSSLIGINIWGHDWPQMLCVFDWLRGWELDRLPECSVQCVPMGSFFLEEIKSVITLGAHMGQLAFDFCVPPTNVMHGASMDTS